MRRVFDTTAWTTRIPYFAYRAFVREEKRAGRAGQAGTRLWIGWLICAVVWLLVVWGGWSIWQNIGGQSGLILGISIAGMLLPGAGFLMLLVMAVVGTAGIAAAAMRRWPLYYRSSQFAQANDLHYVGQIKSPETSSTVLSLGHKVFHDGTVRATYANYVYCAPPPNGFEIGDYRYTEPVSGRDRRAEWAYVRVQLPVAFPHVVFREKRRYPGVAWPKGDWEGLPQAGLMAPELMDFYTLYCPEGFQEQARALFSAELILALKKRRKGLHCNVDGEVIGDQLWLYQYGLPFQLRNAKNVKAAFGILALALERAAALSGNDAVRPLE